MIASNAALARKIKALEKKYGKPFRVVFVAIRQLLEVEESKETHRIGFRPDRNEGNHWANTVWLISVALI